MSQRRYEIVRYTPEFKRQLLQLQTHLWSRDGDLNGAYLRWKYEDNPYLREPLIHLALCQGQVVGMRGMCGARWQVGAPPETFLAPYADDLVVAPEHRNRGLFTRIMRAALDDLADRGVEYVFNLSAGRTTLLGSLSMGWKSAGGVGPVGRRTRPVSGPWQAILARTRFLSRFVPTPRVFARAGDASPFARLDRTLGTAGTGGQHAVWLSRHARPEAMADLVARIPSDGRFRHVRDATYFAWRLCNPFREYRFLYAGEDRLDGYMVLQCQRGVPRDSMRVNIVDWEAIDLATRRALLDTALMGSFAELVMWPAAGDAETRDLLRQRAFAPVDEADSARGVPGILIRPVSDAALRGQWTVGGRQLLEASNWDLRMLYSMHG